MPPPADTDPANSVRYVSDRPAVVRDPPFWSPFAVVTPRLRGMLRDLLEGIGPLDDAAVVDFGSGEAPYRDLFGGATVRCADLPGNGRADVEVRGDGTLPVPSASVDVVFSSQVLEHVADPSVYLSECARILRAGGHLVLSTHGIMYLHPDPEDYWRWTGDGLRLAVERAGLEVVERRGVLGLVGASLQLLQQGLVRSMPRFVRRPTIAAFQLAIRIAERRTSDRSRIENGLVLGIRAVKP